MSCPAVNKFQLHVTQIAICQSSYHTTPCNGIVYSLRTPGKRTHTGGINYFAASARNRQPDAEYPSGLADLQRSRGVFGTRGFSKSAE